VSGETIRLSISFSLAVYYLHVTYIKDKQMLIFNFIFDLLLTCRGFSVSLPAFLRFREQRYIEDHHFRLFELFLNIQSLCLSKCVFRFHDRDKPANAGLENKIYRKHRKKDVHTQRGRKAEFYNLIQESNVVTFVP
jgi:hypothetical protein